MKNLIRNSIIMIVITVVAGAALGCVYAQTKEPIAAAAVNKQQKAYSEVFADAEDFNVISEAPADVKEFGSTVESVAQAVSKGQLLGYVITVTNHDGYSGDITFSVGIKSDGTLSGISILSIAETPGLGMKAQEVIAPQFTDKKSESFSVTKTGEAGDDKINAITGATITSNAVTNGVNAALSAFKELN